MSRIQETVMVVFLSENNSESITLYEVHYAILVADLLPEHP